MSSSRLDNYRQSLQDGKETSVRLRDVRDRMEEAASRGEDVDMYKE